MPDVFLLDPRHEAFLAGTGPGPLPDRNARIMAGFAVAFALLGAPLLGVLAHDAEAQIALDRAGAPAIAVVLATREDTGDESTSYMVRFRFETPDGHPVEAERSVSGRTYRRLGVGDRLSVHYLPDRPDVSRVDEPGAGTQVRWAGAFMLVWMGVVVGLNAWAWPQVLRDRRLRRHCRVLYGRIEEAGGQDDSDGEFELRVDYAFQSPEGRRLTGTFRSTRDDMKGARLPVSGTPLAIAYLDDRTFRPL